MDDLISRQAANDAIGEKSDEIYKTKQKGATYPHDDFFQGMAYAADIIKTLPSAQAETCEYYALCRHGRDERKLRASLGICEYCHEDSDKYVKPIEKNGHAFIHFGMNGWCLELRAKGWHGSTKIMYCPMCGRELKHG